MRWVELTEKDGPMLTAHLVSVEHIHEVKESGDQSFVALATRGFYTRETYAQVIEKLIEASA